MSSVAIVGAGPDDPRPPAHGRQPGGPGPRGGRRGAGGRRADDGRHRLASSSPAARPCSAAVNQPEKWLVDALGARMKPVVRVTSGGGTGLAGALAAINQIKGGFAERVLVVAYDKLSEGALQYSDLDPLRPVLGSRVRGRDHGLLRRLLAGPDGDARPHRGGRGAGRGQEPHERAPQSRTRTCKKEITVEDVLSSRPLCLADQAPRRAADLRRRLRRRARRRGRRREVADSRRGSAAWPTTARPTTRPTAR